MAVLPSFQSSATEALDDEETRWAAVEKAIGKELFKDLLNEREA